MAKHISVTGVVQGVGLRTFVRELASRLDLHGWVCNTVDGVEIFIEGNPLNVESFIHSLETEKPSRVRIDSMSVSNTEAQDGIKPFRILPSLGLEDLSQPVPVDLSICPDCERELFDPKNRRYLYPFISCANCGPRFSIAKDIPYERRNTTMAEFGMCERCSTEYQDASDRRFHAPSTACPECGPFVALREIHSQFPYGGLKISSIECRTSAILKARRLLREGYILGIKSLGGFHLACDASNSLTVEELRDRKGCMDKPFAVMASDIQLVRSICDLGREEEELLAGREKPIVLLQKKTRNGQAYNVSKWVAPNLETLGVMLPYTPLHHLLLNQTDLLLGTEPAPPLLVMTSGSLADEPIATDDEDALLRLSTLVDAFVLHNRDVHLPCDDSVVRVDHGSSTRADGEDHQAISVHMHRGRGYAPYTVHLPSEMKPTLAVGSEFKNAFCLARDRYAFLSHHIGNMENVQTYETFEQSVQYLSHIFHVQPEIIAHDLHPDYFSTQYVRRSTLNARRVGVQHHHAHIASCMADHGLGDRRLIGLCFDGTGLGTDGKIWGGEVLLASYSDFERFAHLEYLPLPGGDSSTRSPWQIACGYAHALGLEIDDLPLLKQIDSHALTTVMQQINEGINLQLCSSMQPLMDAVASLMGVRSETTYEGQSVLEMESLARPFVEVATEYPVLIETIGTETIVRLKGLLSAVIQDVRAETPAGMMAARFQKTIAQAAIEVCRRARWSTGLNEVALSGNLWQNMILLDLVRRGLEREGFTVYFHRQAPTNDSGLALGQALVANFSSDVTKFLSTPGHAPAPMDDEPSAEKIA